MAATSMDLKRPILVAGATGYVAGRLIPALLEKGYAVRAMGRTLEKLACRPWARHPGLELVRGDMLDATSIETACSGCDAAFYLVHSMIAQEGRFAEVDREAARNMAAASEAAGLKRIIYLGGLAEAAQGNLSKHLASRIEVARILQSGTVPTTDLRAAMILGSGSASFEIMRYLVERLPVMTTPRWVRSLCQPIAISNVIGYLIGCLEQPSTTGETYDIGGPDILTYRRLFDIYTEDAGLRERVIIPVPVLTPTLSAYWIRFVTPVPTAIALPLTEGLTSNAVCRDDRIREVIPQKLLTCREAIRRALERVKQEQLDTCWSADGKLLPFEWPYCGDAGYSGGTRFVCAYRAVVAGSAEDLWQPLSRMGGKYGYYYANTLWRLRGLIDRCFGGRGLGTARRSRSGFKPGDSFDFWRVLQANPPRRLRFWSEMKVPGDALLDFTLVPLGQNRSEIQLAASFLPRGLAGILYWYAFLPFHRVLFRGMLSAIARSAGRSILRGPDRFILDAKDVCFLPQFNGGGPP